MQLQKRADLSVNKGDGGCLFIHCKLKQIMTRERCGKALTSATRRQHGGLSEVYACLCVMW